MKILRILYFFLFSTCIMFAQTSTEDADAVALADEMYGFGDKKDALDVYLQATKINPNNVRANFMAGKCYLETIEKPKAASYFMAAYKLNSKVDPDILYYIAKSYHYGNKFDSASAFYTMFKDEVASGKTVEPGHSKEETLSRIEKRLQECEAAKTKIKVKTAFALETVGDHINSEYAEYSPFVTSDETFMVFTSRRKGSTGNFKDVDNEFFEDIYYSKKTNGEWSDPVNFGPPINTQNHEACVGLSLDGKELYIYEESNGGDIYVSHQNADGTWAAPKNFSHKINTKYDEPSLCINKKKDLVFFSSDKPGGTGHLDLFYCEKKNGGDWGDPINLGAEINTTYNEDSPYYDDHTNTLYFSSSGLEGFGGYDVFKSVYDSVSHKWSKPENMGSPINTTDDDLYFMVSEGGKNGYYASARVDGKGEKDIYVINFLPDTNFVAIKKDSVLKDSLSKPPLNELLVGKNQQDNLEATANAKEPKTTNSKTGDSDKGNANKLNTTDSEDPDALGKEYTFKIKSIDKVTKQKLPFSDVEVVNSKGKVVFRGKTDENGEITAVVPNSKDKYFDISSVAKDYMYTSKKVNVGDKSQYDVNVDMNKLEIGYVEVLRHVYFDFNKSNLKPESFPELDKIVKVMKQNPYLKLEVNGHTDNQGSHEFNIGLSQRRAEAAMHYLVSKGVPAARLKAKGYGETRPIASNDDEIEGRELNRRTEVEVIK